MRAAVRLRRLRAGSRGGSAARAGRRASTSTTCSRDRAGRGGGLRRHVRRPVRQRGRTRQQPRRPQRGADVETTATIGFTDALDGVTISLRLTSDAPCPDCSRHRRQAGHQAPHLPRVRGRGLHRRVGRRRVLDERDLPGLRRPAARLRRALPHLPRLRPRACPRARSRPGSPPGSRTASGSGSRARARPARTAARPATSSSTSRSVPHRALRPQGRQPHPRRPGLVRRGRARRRDQGPDAGRRAGHAQDPARHPQRPHLPGPRQGRAAHRRHRRATCWPPSRCRCPRCSTSAAREAVEAYRAATAGKPLRANLFEGAQREQPVRSTPGPDAAVYVISVAAELTGLHPQTLRAYERMGLITPGPHRRRRPPLLPPRHRAAALDRRAHLRRHRHRGRTPAARARDQVDRPACPQRGAGRRAGGHPGGAAPGRSAPAYRRPRPTGSRAPQPPPGQSMVVWRRGR